MLRLFILWVCVGSLSGFCSEKEKKYNFSVCAIFSNETRYLKEWIEYHELIGVDHFYLYKNGEDSSAKEILKPFIKKGTVTLIPWNETHSSNQGRDGFTWSLSTQLPAYENAIYVRGAAETKWMICLDVNEYLVLAKKDQIGEILAQYGDLAGLSLSTDCFDSSKMNTQPNIRLMIENKELIAPPKKENINRKVNKIIFKPELCSGFQWPPYQCRFKGGHDAKKVDRAELRVNRYIYAGKGYFENLKRKFHGDNRILSEREISDLLNEGYEIEDQERAIDRFLPQLRKKMGLSAQWE